MPDIGETVRESLLREVERARELSKDAVRSGTYLYPVKGILYYLTHRHLWAPLLSQFIPMVTLSVGVIAFMFVFAYPPQVAVLAVVNRPLAIVVAGLLVMGECSAIVGVVGRWVFMEGALVDTFDAVLVEKGMANIVSEGRQINSGSRDAIGKLGKLIKKPSAMLSPGSVIRYLMYLPLNAIPVVGPGVFLVLQGKRTGPSYHNRYFQLKGWSSSQSRKWVEEHGNAYTSFGITTTLLELTPPASIFFAFTNTVGAALWAVDIELEHLNSTTAPKLREKVREAE
ncbi:MAG: hypothetical protein M1813_008086 [Trichoglossum hirsutum]|nr:MAG: hypothetical protein M1813_008086 [Trichoglossum hirsutum]